MNVIIINFVGQDTQWPNINNILSLTANIVDSFLVVAKECSCHHSSWFVFSLTQVRAGRSKRQRILSWFKSHWVTTQSQMSAGVKAQPMPLAMLISIITTTLNNPVKTLYTGLRATPPDNDKNSQNIKTDNENISGNITTKEFFLIQVNSETPLKL